MALDRDELAARATSARAALLALCDALRPEAVAPAPSRPEWVPKVGDRVRVTRDRADYSDAKRGDEYVVSKIVHDDGPVSKSFVYGLPSGEFIRVENLEPCAAPSPAASPAAIVGEVGTVAALASDPQPEWVRPPAASPAPYVPKCGDVVRHINDAPGTDDRIVTESLCDGAFRMLSLRYSNLSSSGYNVAAFWRFVRPATASERAAAGLPVEAPCTVDRVALAKVMRAAFHKATYGGEADAWDDCSETGKRGYLAEADAAIAFLKANGGVA